MASKSQSSKEQPRHRPLTRRSYKQLVISAIQNLKEKGSTEKSIRNYLIRESDINDDDEKALLNIKLAIKECISEGSLKKGKSGIFQLDLSPCKKDELKKERAKKRKGKSRKKKGKSKKMKKGKRKKRRKKKAKKRRKPRKKRKKKRSSKKKRKSRKTKKRSIKRKKKSACAPRPIHKKRR